MSRRMFTRRKSQRRLVLYAIQHGASATAKHYGISRSTVYAVFRRLRLAPPSEQPGYTGPTSDLSRNHESARRGQR